MCSVSDSPCCAQGCQQHLGNLEPVVPCGAVQLRALDLWGKRTDRRVKGWLRIHGGFMVGEGETLKAGIRAEMDLWLGEAEKEFVVASGSAKVAEFVARLLCERLPGV